MQSARKLLSRIPSASLFWGVAPSAKGTMLPGFAKGVSGMGVGERRLIHIPWKLGYGKKGRA